MSTELVLTYLLVDDTHEQDKVFNSVTELAVWLHGRRETDFVWLTLHGDTTNDGWSAILDFIHKSIQCNPSKSSCIALSEPQHSMEDSEMVIDPFDTYEPGELPHVPVGTLTFGELEDGAEFYVAITWAYGSRNKLQKVIEDGEHNAVWCSATHIGELIPDGIRVVRA